MKKAVIVLPTYNEAGNIKEVLDKIVENTKSSTKWKVEILVVDSKSKDGTSQIVKNLQKKYPQIHLMETEKEGLGKAYTRGFTYAIQHLHPYLIFEMDADLSHNPKMIPKFLKEIEEGADFVIGSRYIKGGSIPKDWGMHRKFFSFFGNLIVRFGFMKLSVSDWTSGYRAIKTWVIKSALNHIKHYSGYVFQIALLDQAIKNRAVVKEVPINFVDRKAGVSKINLAQNTFQNLLYIFTYSSFIKFVIVGFIGFIIDFGISYLLIEKAQAQVWLSTAASAETAIISNFLLNNFWSFSHKKIEVSLKSYTSSFIKFNLVSSGSLLIQITGLQILVVLLGKKFWYLYKVLIIAFVIIPYSYILYNKVIWKDKG